MEAVKTINLTKKYKELVAVDRINLTVRHGELFSLLGVNGAGKTTLLKMLSALTRPTYGEAYLNGYSVRTEFVKVKKIIGMSPQETAVAPNLSVEENLYLMCGVHGIKKQEGKERVRQIISRLELQSVLGRKAGKLSGGWQRRLSIAMALVCEPSILFLDEPTLGLDVLARKELHDVIKTLSGDVTVIMTTHYLEEAQALSDRIGIMKEGRILTVGTVDEIKLKTGKNSLEEAFIETVKGAEK